MICVAFVLRNGSWYHDRNFAVIVLRVDSCVQYDHINRCYSPKLSRLCQHGRCDHRAVSFPEVFRSFTREIPHRAFREWPIAIKRNETAEKVKKRKTEKKRSEKRERTRGRRYARLRERETAREGRIGGEREGERERGKEKEHAHRAGT